MKKNALLALSPLFLAVGLHAEKQNELNADSLGEQEIEKLTIVGTRDNRISEGATGLIMDISETPQSISILGNQAMENFAAFSINDALKLANGITVEEWETNRTNYTSRGFEIKNTQIDGVGLPNNWGIVTGAIDVYGYDKIEVIRGANGLLTGVGNASGTINCVRKRPTNETKGQVTAALGSFDFQRVQADYSTALTDDGSWAGRIVATTEDKASHLNGLQNDRSFVYGVIDGQLSEYATLTFGYSLQDANTKGNTWGGLVFNYSDGSQAEWDVSDTTTQEWTQWDTINESAFVELGYLLPNNWDLKLTYNHRNFEGDSKLFYAYGVIDPETGLGLTGWPGRYYDERSNNLFEASVAGFYTLFGKEHQLLLGASTASSDSNSSNNTFDFVNTPAYGPTPAFPYGLDAIEEPQWSAERSLYSDLEQSLSRIYGTTRLSVTDDLYVIAGFNAIRYEREGVNNGTQIDQSESELSPYVGLTYNIVEDINLYFSYSDIYQPQEQYDITGQYLDPTKGVNVEGGVKAQLFAGKLLATVAVFNADQQNLATYAGTNPDTLQYYYEGTDVESKGYELELVGQASDNVTVNLAYTSFKVNDIAGNETNLWAPQQKATFSVDYSLPQLDQLTIGLGGKWQSEISNTTYNLHQGAYSLLNVFARYNLSEQLRIQANLNNITDEKYINSLHTVGYYGAPVNGSVSINYSF